MSERGAEADGWRNLAVDLWTEGGLPAKRARVVALVATGRTHAETAERLGLSSRSEVSTHIARYRDGDLPEARWLAEHGPEL